MRVKLMGVRGTVPVHGAGCVEFGGATSCVFVDAGDEPIVLDAGTGLLTQPLRPFFPDGKLTLLLTHSHADHIIGLPIFPPLFDPSFRCDIYLRTRNSLSAREQVEQLMSPPLWPVTTAAAKAELDFRDVEPSFDIGAVRVDTMESKHPGGSTIYRISRGEKSLVYATDYEPESDAPEDFCEFARGCSLLLIDAQYTDGEYATARGFGHSTVTRSAAIAKNCGAQRTVFVHHDPRHSDTKLLELEREIQKLCPTVSFGREGEEIYL